MLGLRHYQKRKKIRAEGYMKILHYQTYLKMIHNSEGSRMYRTLYAERDGAVVDITKDGLVSCAFFVSSILAHFKVLEAPHATVEGAVRDMERSGWRTIDAAHLRPGDVVVWEKGAEADGEQHLHMGFYLDPEHAMSHSDKERAPAVHALTFNGRAIVAAYTHPFVQ
jgi:hypothetical protein